jgi:hypothetical protein
MFIAHLRLNEKKHLIGFKCPNVAACHYLWRCAVEQRYFFTMKSSNDIPFETTGGGIFSRSCKVRYSGRVEREVIEDMRSVQRKEGSTIRRSYSTTSAPPSMRTLGRSNTAPMRSHDLGDDSPSATFRDKAPYINYTTFSEPGDDHGQGNSTHPHLDTFDEEDWDMSMTSSLPTEFDMRPDLTPTGEESHHLSFEIPEVRGSPSRTGNNSGHYSDDYMPDESCFDEQNPPKIRPNSSSTKKRTFRFARGSQPLAKLFAVVRTSILSTLLLLFLFTCLIVLVIELDTDMFSQLRKLPEMVMLRREYYEPIKKKLLRAVVA